MEVKKEKVVAFSFLLPPEWAIKVIRQFEKEFAQAAPSGMIVSRPTVAGGQTKVSVICMEEDATIYQNSLDILIERYNKISAAMKNQPREIPGRIF